MTTKVLNQITYGRFKSGRRLTISSSGSGRINILDKGVIIDWSTLLVGHNCVFGPYFRDYEFEIQPTVGEITVIEEEVHDQIITSQPRWDDLRFEASGINPPGGVSDPDRDTSELVGSLLFANNTTNLIGGGAQVPHDWVKGTLIRPHCHWCKSTSASGGVAWQFSKRYAEVGEVFNNYDAFTSNPGTLAVTHGNTALQHALSTFPDIDLEDRGESTMIYWKLQRDHDAGSDSYGADAHLLELDFHYQRSSIGSYDEYPTG